MERKSGRALREGWSLDQFASTPGPLSRTVTTGPGSTRWAHSPSESWVVTVSRVRTWLGEPRICRKLT